MLRPLLIFYLKDFAEVDYFGCHGKQIKNAFISGLNKDRFTNELIDDSLSNYLDRDN